MWFVSLGVVMTALKLLGAPFMDGVSWWWVAAPYAAAAVWWALADQFGITQRRLMADEKQRADDRRQRQYEAMGMRVPGTKIRRDPAAKGYPPHRH